MAGRFVLKPSSDGRFHFNLVAGNGEVIVESEMYSTKQAAMNGIEAVKSNAPDARVDDEAES